MTRESERETEGSGRRTLMDSSCVCAYVCGGGVRARACVHVRQCVCIPLGEAGD